MKRPLITALVVGFLTFFHIGCGQLQTTSSQNSSTCSDATALIAVFDAAYQILCGCNEDAATFHPGEPLTCTVAAGTTVVFNYLGSTADAQVISEGASTFPNSPVYSPLSDEPIRTHSYQFDTAGTYNFLNSFNRQSTGSIVVN